MNPAPFSQRANPQIIRHTEGPLTDWLREYTRPLHRALDTSPMLHNLLRPELSIADYATTLRALHQAHTRAETCLQTLAHARPPALPPYVARSPALARDLLAVETLRANGTHTAPPSVHVSEAILAAASPATDPPRVTHTDPHATYLGLRYVLEGASLGSRVIAQQLKKRWPEIEQLAFAYWGLQSELMQHWLGVCEQINSHPAGLHESSLLQGAETAYHCFLSVFRPETHDTTHL